MSNTAPPYAATALALSVKHWKDLGIDDGDEETAPTNDLDTLVERLTAILVVRCVAIVAEKDEFNDLSTATICRSTLMRQAAWPEPITADVVEQIRTFVHAILSRYNDNPYHNRQHAYHVTTSAHKLLELMLLEKQQTFGLRNDPLMQFALIFAALIHDVEHQGLPNRQLCNEAAKLAVTYNDQSVAENRSLAIGFHELLKDDYKELRAVLFGNSNEADPSQSDYQRFRRQVISLVLTTDIANPERTALFKSKWVEAFESPLVDDDVSVLEDDDEKKDQKEGEDEEDASESRDVVTSDKVGERRRSNASTGSLRSRGSSRGGTRLGMRMSIDLSGEALHIYKQVGNSKNSEEPDELKISVLLELFLTAADVSHNLQGWEQMVKWSNCLYLELQRALLMGRGTDPKPNWFQNQIGFLEFYLLPLANKLDETGVFGGFVGKQFATTVLANRDRWVKKGQKVTDQIIEEGKKMVIDNATTCNPCRMDDEADGDLDPESGEMEASNEPGEGGSPTDWVKVFMFVVIVLLLGVILQLSQILRHPRTSPKGNPGLWKINCRKLGKAVSPMERCKDGYLRIDSGGHATFHVSDNCDDSGMNSCFRNAPILTQQDLMKIGLSTVPFEEENLAIA
ncbi:cAMP-specific phosphodiesterase 4 [Fistulifera solaris]|uniref:cAMP-specific phosphodiesterase 4 n=1 Tax=Fistulifera solaris TaxID=1519565 RepID=A0A1Z5JY48_FISSO|nr:cAMP-specific phosphodiesterase 4 [Fistulifera solaris]|eukprot:GAX18681.1 cAMP-specific phosphodiesterase 4 [Fistulifera solaris]